MIRIATPGSGQQPPRVYLGLSHGNLDRLREGQPIQVDVDQCAALGLGQLELVIYTGANEIEMSQELEDHGLIKAGATDRLREEFARREQT